MAGGPDERKGFSLRRWSARKHEVSRAEASQPRTDRTSTDETAAARVDPRMLAVSPVAPGTAVDSGAVTDVQGATRVAAAGTRVVSPGEPNRPLPELPPIDALTIDSDYSGFMQPGVDDALKRGALKKLFSDPRFNVMDGLDVYIDDYSKPDPIEPELVRKLVQARYIFNPPATRVNAQGFVEDVPEAELAQQPPTDDGEALGDTQTGAATNVPAIAAPDVDSIAVPDVDSIAALSVPAAVKDETAAAPDQSSDAAALAARQT